MPVNKSSCRLLIVIIAGLLLCAPEQVFSQNTNQNGNRQDFGNTSAIYVIDEIGAHLMSDGFTLEGSIDPETYQVGPRDMITVNIQGPIPITFRGLAVSAQGYLVIPGVGSVYINELTVIEARSRIQELIRGFYQFDELHVFVEIPKPITVHITGTLFQPRPHTLPPRTRLSVALNPILIEVEEKIRLDLRSVELRRRNGETHVYDLLSYRLNGDLENNPFLHDGDVIVLKDINSFTNGVSVSGAVFRPFDSSYRIDDTLGRVLQIAGGPTAIADTNHVFISRINPANGQTEKIRVSDPTTQNANYTLQPNDRVIVPFQEISSRNHIVRTSGEINHPGTFSITSNGITLDELLQLAGGPTRNALQQGAYILRSTPEIPSTVELVTRGSDQFIEGLEYLLQEFRINESILFVDIRDESLRKNTVLKHGDVLHLPSDTRSVLIAGQVQRTGQLSLTDGDSVMDYINRAGGFGAAADVERIFVLKASGRAWVRPEETIIESGDIIFVDRIPYEEYQNFRIFTLQNRQLRNSNIQLGLSTIATVASVIVTYLAVRR